MSFIVGFERSVPTYVHCQIVVELKLSVVKLSGSERRSILIFDGRARVRFLQSCRAASATCHVFSRWSRCERFFEDVGGVNLQIIKLLLASQYLSISNFSPFSTPHSSSFAR